MEQKITIPIPKAEEGEVAIIPAGKGGVSSYIKNKFEKIDQVIYGVMISVVLSMVAIIISVIGLFMDQLRYNNLAYKEYSQKTKSLEEIEKINTVLLGRLEGLIHENNEKIK